MTRRILLDEGVPRQLVAALDSAGFSTSRYPNAWKQISNGELLRRAEEQAFDVLVTSDKNIYAQQNLRGRTLAIVVLPTNLRRHVMARADDLADTISRIHPGQYVVIEPSGERPVIDYNSPTVRGEMPAVAPFKNR